MTSKEILRMMKANIESRMSNIYNTTLIEGEKFFLSKKNTPFRVCALFPDILVIEYADTWEDGDCFSLQDMNEEELFKAMIQEIEE